MSIGFQVEGEQMMLIWLILDKSRTIVLRVPGAIGLDLGLYTS